MTVTVIYLTIRTSRAEKIRNLVLKRTMTMGKRRDKQIQQGWEMARTFSERSRKLSIHCSPSIHRSRSTPMKTYCRGCSSITERSRGQSTWSWSKQFPFGLTVDQLQLQWWQAQLLRESSCCGGRVLCQKRSSMLTSRTRLLITIKRRRLLELVLVLLVLSISERIKKAKAKAMVPKQM